MPVPIADVVDGALKRPIEERWASMPELLSYLVAAARKAGVPVADPRLRG